MREFFKGWRRKAGCILLVLAIGSTTALVRSYATVDRIDFAVAEHHVALLTARGYASLHKWSDGIKPKTRWQSVMISDENTRYHTDGLTLPEAVTWMLADAIAIIPYQIISMPLSLLSAYLIIWKPRKRERLVNSAAPNF